MKKVLLLLSLLAAILPALAQRPQLPYRERPVFRPSEILPAPVAPVIIPNAKSLAPPPPQPVRVMAEWEEIQALVITWTSYTDILTEIVRHAVGECRVIIITDAPGAVSGQLSAENIPLDNVEFLNVPHNSIWIRDYGPWTVYYNDVDSLAITDFKYNRPQRPDDDLIPEAVAEYLGLPYHGAVTPPDDWTHTGGNNLRDGMGTIFSSELTLGENLYKNEFQVDSIARRYLGAERFVKYPILPYDAIHHVDMHMRIIDEETFIVGQYPEGVADGPQIEANVDYLKTHFRTPFGNIYNIVRVPMPPDFLGRYPDQNGDYRTYANAIFLNKTILVPTYEEQYDSTALQIYEEQLPGYNVVGIDCNDIITAFGALHCITKVVGVPDPLWIATPRLRDTYAAGTNFPVTARIRHRSGIAGAVLHYRTDPGAAYTAVPMTLEDAETATWTAVIPGQSAGTDVQYYIEATANSGKVQVRPQVAPEGFFRFRVKTAQSAPVASFLYSKDDPCPGEAIQFVDESAEAAVWSWQFPGGEPAASTEAHPVVTYAAPGVYDVSLIVSNALGADTLTLSQAVQVEEGVTPFFEGFTGGPEDEWEVDDHNSDGVSWAASNPFDCYGQALMMDNYFNDTRNHRDFLRTRFDLSGLTEVTLNFDVAYAPYGADFFDGLRVNVIDCEGNKAILYSEAGVNLATDPATGDDLYIPSGCDAWRRETIDLSAYDGELVTLEFENAGGYGNRLYLDNIDISSPQLPNQGPVVFLTAPSDGTFYQDELPTFALTASAGDIDGLVRIVRFYANGEVVATDSVAPYAVDFTVPGYDVYTFFAEAEDNDGAFAQSAVATVTVEETVATEEAPGPPFHLSVYPNPTGDRVWVRVEAPGSGRLHYRLTDLLGRTVQMYEWPATGGEQTRQLDVSGLPAGIYHLSLQQGQRMVTRRVVKSQKSQ